MRGAPPVSSACPVSLFASHHAWCVFFSSRRRHTILQGDWSSDVCSSDLLTTLDTKQHILDAAGFAYNFDRRVYFNRKSKKIFSVAFLEDQSEAEIERLIRDDTGDKEWKFPVGRTERRANAAGRARSRGAQIRRPQPTGSGRARHQPAAHRQEIG